MNNKPICSFKERFREALDVRNMKQIELSEKTKIAKGSINHYLSGYSEPKSDKLYIIAKALDVSETWLMGYDVPMQRIDIKKAAQADAELLILFKKLNEENKTQAKNYINFLLSQQE